MDRIGGTFGIEPPYSATGGCDFFQTKRGDCRDEGAHCTNRIHSIGSAGRGIKFVISEAAMAGSIFAHAGLPIKPAFCIAELEQEMGLEAQGKVMAFHYVAPIRCYARKVGENSVHCLGRFRAAPVVGHRRQRDTYKASSNAQGRTERGARASADFQR